MSDLTFQQQLDRLNANEERLDKFVNDPVGYTSSDAQPVKSLKAFGVTLAGYEGEALALKNQAQDAANLAGAFAVNAEAFAINAQIQVGLAEGHAEDALAEKLATVGLRDSASESAIVAGFAAQQALQFAQPSLGVEFVAYFRTVIAGQEYLIPAFREIPAFPTFSLNFLSETYKADFPGEALVQIDPTLVLDFVADVYQLDDGVPA